MYVTFVALLILNDLYTQPAVARPIEFTEKNTLPPAEFQLSVGNKNRCRIAGQRRLYMRIRVSLRVAITSASRNQAVESRLDIASNIGIVMLVHHDTCGRVRHIKVTHATCN